jgi:Ni/Co efflux regulator RcnB
MNKSAAKSPRWIVLMSGVGLIAITAPIFADTSALAGTAADSSYLQVADNQQPPPPPKGQKGNEPQGQQHNNQSQGQQHNNQTQGQQYNNQQPKTYVQPQGQQYNTQQQPKTYEQPKTYVQPQGQQYNNQQQPKNNQQPKTYVQPQGQQYQQQQPKNNQQGHRYDWSAYQPGHRPPQWDQYHNNFDPRPYEGNRYAERRYNWEPYRQPQGWYYRQWGYGQIFPPVFWTQDYWINDYWDFGLADPPYGYVWVRYGPDALLVAVDNGQILSVVYGLFA